MEVSEGDVDRDEHNVGWVTEEVAPKLDSFAEDKCPQRQGDEEGLSFFGWPRLRCLVPRVEDEAVVRECPCGDSRLEYGISAPWLGPTLRLVSGRHVWDCFQCLPPVMTFDKQAGQVAAPVAANPSETLAQIFRAVLQCRLHFGLFVILHSNLPVVRIQPTSDKVVIVGVELASPPLFVSESVGEGFVLQDAAAIRGAASRQARQTTVDVKACRAIEVAAFQVCRAQEVPNADRL